MPPPGHRASECQTKSLTQDDIFLKPIFTSLGNSELLSLVKQRSIKNALCLICCPHIGSKHLCFMFICAFFLHLFFTMLSGSGQGMKNLKFQRGTMRIRDTKGIFQCHTAHKQQRMMFFRTTNTTSSRDKTDGHILENPLYSHNRPIKNQMFLFSKANLVNIYKMVPWPSQLLINSSIHFQQMCSYS